MDYRHSQTNDVFVGCGRPAGAWLQTSPTPPGKLGEPSLAAARPRDQCLLEDMAVACRCSTTHWDRDRVT
jgi:hypothetical protein